MKKMLTWYFVLTLLLIMGAFASMALNAYGIVLMGYVSLGFALALLFELVYLIRTERLIADKAVVATELVALICLSVVYFLTVIVFEVKYEQVITTGLSLVLIGINIFFFAKTLRSQKDQPAKIRLAVGFYFVAVLLVWIAAYAFRFQLYAGLYVTLAAVISLVAFAVTGWWRGDVVVAGESTNAIPVVAGLRNKASLELVIIGLMVIYFSLSSTDLLPPLYIGNQPSGYAKVVKNAPASVAKFEEAYRKFVKDK